MVGEACPDAEPRRGRHGPARAGRLALPSVGDTLTRHEQTVRQGKRRLRLGDRELVTHPKRPSSARSVRGLRESHSHPLGRAPVPARAAARRMTCMKAATTNRSPGRVQRRVTKTGGGHVRQRARGAGEIVLTPEGYEKLQEEHRRLTTVVRHEVAARLGEASEFPGDLGDNSEYLDACADRDLVEQRIALLERRLNAAHVLEAEEVPSGVISFGSHVVLESLDDGTREQYMLVSSAESNLEEGLLSNESPVGRAITGRRKGDVVEVRAPHRIRRLRIADLHSDDTRCSPLGLGA
jgi:transcription elongation factor GreA